MKEAELETPEKLCPKCGELWPADAEFFHRNQTRPDGLATYCRACYLEIRANFYKRHKR